MSRLLRLSSFMVRLAARDSRVDLLISKYPSVPLNTIKTLEGMDPSGMKGTYLEWLIRQYLRKNISWDQSEIVPIRTVLEKYDSIRKNNLGKIFEVDPDINKYNFQDLARLYRDVAEILSVVYDNPPYKIIRIRAFSGRNTKKVLQTACYYARNTRWCTRDEGAAKAYLEEMPLYIIFKNGLKIAQSDSFQQVMGLKNQDITFDTDPGLFDALEKSGVINKFKFLYHRAIFGKPLTETESSILAQSPEYSYRYSMETGPFPLGEKSIARSPKYSYLYAKNVLGNRFLLGEKAIKRVPNLYKMYSDLFLQGNSSVETFSAHGGR